MEGAHAETPTVLTTTAAYRAFDKAWKATGSAAHDPSDVSIVDAYTICALASAEAHSTSPGAVTSNIRKVAGPPGTPFNYLSLAAALKAAWQGKDINYDGLSSNLNFDAAGDPGQVLFQIVSFKNGNQVAGPYTTAKR